MAAIISRNKRRATVVIVLVVLTITFHVTAILYILRRGCFAPVLLNQDAVHRPFLKNIGSSSINSSKSMKHSDNNIAIDTDDINYRPSHLTSYDENVRDGRNFLFESKVLKGTSKSNQKLNHTIMPNDQSLTEHYEKTSSFDHNSFIKHLLTTVRPTYENQKTVKTSPNNTLPRTHWHYNCSTISRMKLLHPIGRGISKQTFVAEADNGVKVAVKMVTRRIQGVKECLHKLKTRQQYEYYYKLENGRIVRTHKNNDTLLLKSITNGNINTFKESSKFVDTDSSDEENLKKDFKEESRSDQTKKCYIPATRKLLKDILLSMELSHRNVASLLGFCVRSDEFESTDVSQQGVVAVFELGSRFPIDSLQILPWQQRLRHALEMAELLVYLQESPMGSLIAPDMKEAHLIKVKGRIKLIDLDDVTNAEPECEKADQGHRSNVCKLNTLCVGNMCEGFNAKKNLYNFNTLLFKRLLFPLTFPDIVAHRLGQLNARLDSLALTADDLQTELGQIMEDLGVETT